MLYRSVHTPAAQHHPRAVCSSDTLDTEDTASRPGKGGRGSEGGPSSCHDNSVHSNSTSTVRPHHRSSSTAHTERTLHVCVVHTVCVSAPSPAERLQRQHRGSGSSAHSSFPCNAAMHQADDRMHTPACSRSRRLYLQRAVIGPRRDTPPLTTMHTAGERSTDLWSRTVIGR